MDVQIRKWKLSDAKDLAAALNNKKIQDNLRDGIPYPYTVSDAEEYLRAVLTADKGSRYDFAICADGKVIGSIGVFRGRNVHRLTGEMGYYIAEPYWGKGVCTTAVRYVCGYVFAHTDIIRIFAEPYAYNIASCRVLEKSGFALEGVMRKNAVKNGQAADMKLYALVKE